MADTVPRFAFCAIGGEFRAPCSRSIGCKGR